MTVTIAPARERQPAATSTVPAPVASPGSHYLDPAVTGTRWLYDIDRLPPDRASADDPFPSMQRRVATRKAAADLRLLGDAMAETYGRADQYRERGIDVREVFERHAQRVEQLRRTTFGDAFVPAIRELRAGLGDQHLQLYIDGANQLIDSDPRIVVREFRGDPVRLGLAQAVQGAIAVTAAEVPLLATSGTPGRTGSISIRGRDGDAELAHLGYRSVTETAPNLVPRMRPLYTLTSVGDTAIIDLPRFSDSNPKVAEALRAFVLDAPKHRAFRNIVFDLRGNGGGNDGYVGEWIRLFRARDFELRDLGARSFPNDKTRAIAAWNVAAWAKVNIPDAPDVDDMWKDAQQLKKHWPLSDATRLPPEESTPEHGAADTNWDGKVFVLVDRRNGSSGESTALMLREWMGAAIVGERTGGALEGNNVMGYKMPNTGVELGIPSRRTTYFDKRVGEDFGIPIDIALADPSVEAAKLVPHLVGAGTT